MATQAQARVTNFRPNFRPQGKQIAFPTGHNFCDAGNGVDVCRECGAELKTMVGYREFIPGDGSCDK